MTASTQPSDPRTQQPDLERDRAAADLRGSHSDALMVAAGGRRVSTYRVQIGTVASDFMRIVVVHAPTLEVAVRRSLEQVDDLEKIVSVVRIG